MLVFIWSWLWFKMKLSTWTSVEVGVLGMVNSSEEGKLSMS